jgi:hypothetical protein
MTTASHNKANHQLEKSSTIGFFSAFPSVPCLITGIPHLFADIPPKIPLKIMFLSVGFLLNHHGISRLSCPKIPMLRLRPALKF